MSEVLSVQGLCKYYEKFRLENIAFDLRPGAITGFIGRNGAGKTTEGMKVKYALTLALSHGAELLLLDEPTSGLDPVSRDELLEIFLDLAERGTTILFSTHITSDLEKSADDIIYIKGGRVVERGAVGDFLARYRVARWTGEAPAGALMGVKRDKTGSSALVAADFAAGEGVILEDADLETVMVHMEREGAQ